MLFIVTVFKPFCLDQSKSSICWRCTRVDRAMGRFFVEIPLNVEWTILLHNIKYWEKTNELWMGNEMGCDRIGKSMNIFHQSFVRSIWRIQKIFFKSGQPCLFWNKADVCLSALFMRCVPDTPFALYILLGMEQINSFCDTVLTTKVYRVVKIPGSVWFTFIPPQVELAP